MFFSVNKRGKSPLFQSSIVKEENTLDIANSEREATSNNNYGSSGKNQENKLEKRDEKAERQFHDQIRDAHAALKIGQVKQSLQLFDIVVQKAIIELPMPSFEVIFQKVLKIMNFASIDYLNTGELDNSIQILQKCELWLSNPEFGLYPSLQALTLNHFGCNFRRRGNFAKAFQYFDQALSTLLQANSRTYLGLTYLNKSALQSQVGNHAKALEFAKTALMECQYEFYELTKNSNKEQLQQDPDYFNKVTTLVVCYHNIAVEEEYFKNYNEALIHFESSCSIAEDHLSADHKLTVQFKNEYHKFQKRYQNAMLQKQATSGNGSGNGQANYDKNSFNINKKPESLSGYLDIFGSIIKDGLQKSQKKNKQASQSSIGKLIKKDSEKFLPYSIEQKAQIYNNAKDFEFTGRPNTSLRKRMAKNHQKASSVNTFSKNGNTLSSLNIGQQQAPQLDFAGVNLNNSNEATQPNQFEKQLLLAQSVTPTQFVLKRQNQNQQTQKQFTSSVRTLKSPQIQLPNGNMQNTGVTLKPFTAKRRIFSAKPAMFSIQSPQAGTKGMSQHNQIYQQQPNTSSNVNHYNNYLEESKANSRVQLLNNLKQQYERAQQNIKNIELQISKELNQQDDPDLFNIQDQQQQQLQQQIGGNARYNSNNNQGKAGTNQNNFMIRNVKGQNGQAISQQNFFSNGSNPHNSNISNPTTTMSNSSNKNGQKLQFSDQKGVSQELFMKSSNVSNASHLSSSSSTSEDIFNVPKFTMTSTDKKSKVNGKLQFILYRTKCILLCQFSSELLEAVLQHSFNVSDIANNCELENNNQGEEEGEKRLRRILVSLSKELQLMLFMSKNREFLQLDIQNTVSKNVQHSGGNLPIKIHFKDINEEVELVEKNQSSSIILMRGQTQQSLDTDKSDIKPLISKNIPCTAEEEELSQDTIQPLISQDQYHYPVNNGKEQQQQPKNQSITQPQPKQQPKQNQGNNKGKSDLKNNDEQIDEEINDEMLQYQPQFEEDDSQLQYQQSKNKGKSNNNAGAASVNNQSKTTNAKKNDEQQNGTQSKHIQLKNDKGEVIIEGDQQELNNVAILIQNQFRNKLKNDNSKAQGTEPNKQKLQQQPQPQQHQQKQQQQQQNSNNSSKATSANNKNQDSKQSNHIQLKNEQGEVIIEGDQQELNNVAILIQNQFRNKLKNDNSKSSSKESANQKPQNQASKQQLQQQQHQQQNGNKSTTNTTQSNNHIQLKNEKGEVVIEGDQQELNNVAILIQNQFRNKLKNDNAKANKTNAMNKQPATQKPQQQQQQIPKKAVNNQMPDSSQTKHIQLKNEKGEVVIEGDQQELNNVAILIQNQFRNKLKNDNAKAQAISKQPATQNPQQKPPPQQQQQKQQQQQQQTTNKPVSNNKPEPSQAKHIQLKNEKGEVVIEGDQQELNNVAILIQNQFRNKLKNDNAKSQNQKPQQKNNTNNTAATNSAKQQQSSTNVKQQPQQKDPQKIQEEKEEENAALFIQDVFRFKQQKKNENQGKSNNQQEKSAGQQNKKNKEDEKLNQAGKQQPPHQDTVNNEQSKNKNQQKQNIQQQPDKNLSKKSQQNDATATTVNQQQSQQEKEDKELNQAALLIQGVFRFKKMKQGNQPQKNEQINAAQKANEVNKKKNPQPQDKKSDNPTRFTQQPDPHKQKSKEDKEQENVAIDIQTVNRYKQMKQQIKTSPRSNSNKSIENSSPQQQQKDQYQAALLIQSVFRYKKKLKSQHQNAQHEQTSKTIEKAKNQPPSNKAQSAVQNDAKTEEQEQQQAASFIQSLFRFKQHQKGKEDANSQQKGKDIKKPDQNQQNKVQQNNLKAVATANAGQPDEEKEQQQAASFIQSLFRFKQHKAKTGNKPEPTSNLKQNQQTKSAQQQQADKEQKEEQQAASFIQSLFRYKQHKAKEKGSGAGTGTGAGAGAAGVTGTSTNASNKNGQLKQNNLDDNTNVMIDGMKLEQYVNVFLIEVSEKYINSYNPLDVMKDIQLGQDSQEEEIKQVQPQAQQPVKKQQIRHQYSINIIDCDNQMKQDALSSPSEIQEESDKEQQPPNNNSQMPIIIQTTQAVEEPQQQQESLTEDDQKYIQQYLADLGNQSIQVALQQIKEEEEKQLKTSQNPLQSQQAVKPNNKQTAVLPKGKEAQKKQAKKDDSEDSNSEASNSEEEIPKKQAKNKEQSHQKEMKGQKLKFKSGKQSNFVF